MIKEEKIIIKMSEFSLYQSLTQKISKRELSDKQRKQMIKFIPKMNHLEKQQLLGLILEHFISKSTGEEKFDKVFPFSIQFEKEIIIPFEVLDKTIERILFKFCLIVQKNK